MRVDGTSELALLVRFMVVGLFSLEVLDAWIEGVNSQGSSGQPLERLEDLNEGVLLV